MSKPYLIIHVTDDGSIGKIWQRDTWSELQDFVIEKAHELLNIDQIDVEEILDDSGCTISRDGYSEYLVIAQTEDE